MTIGILFLAFYFVAWRYVYLLCQYGGVARRLPILVIAVAGMLVCMIIAFVRHIQREGEIQEIVSQEEEVRKKRVIISVLIGALVITAFYGYRTVRTGVNYNGKLSWKLQDIQSKRSVTLEKDNLYQDGVRGILDAMREKTELPEQLYVANRFELRFQDDGTITEIYAFLYGKDAKGNTRSYLISYDKETSDKLVFYLDGYANADYSQGKALKPFLEVMQRAPIESLTERISSYQPQEREWGLLYYGVRDWRRGANGITYVDKDGNTKQMVYEDAAGKVAGFTTSLYIPGMSDEWNSDISGNTSYSPIRLIPVEDFEDIPAVNRFAVELVEKDEKEHNDQMTGLPIEEESQSRVGGYEDPETRDVGYFLTEKLGYRMTMIDAACGTYYYALEKTVDGRVWKRINNDPFNGMGGTVAEVTFTDESNGIAVLTKNGGDDVYTFSTADGGMNWSQDEFIEGAIGD